MKPHALETAHAERRESVVVLKAPEFALHGRAAPVEVAEALSVTRDAREQPAADSYRQDWLLAAHAPTRTRRCAPAGLAARSLNRV